MTGIEVRHSIVNGSATERLNMVLPSNFVELDWENLDYLGWRDSHSPHLGYIIRWQGETPVGIIVREADGPLSRQRMMMCQLCRATHTEHGVSLFSAKRTGEAGLNGNTVGTYICANLGCSSNIRVEVPSASYYADPQSVLAQKVSGLEQRVAGFLADVMRAQ
ncbi:FBP domain-containing protein [Subtercola endophyticus]|uniref:FBP domain-containing protein n=1 Tax=Subtercola endophyticus TaxID=2895559 RepID=UPI001E5574A8|nr:FBP domain-containing protein [Subtercola endophyticus]UFS61245.1 FBP domain-containing protein [Subtercola endophyticus]